MKYNLAGDIMKNIFYYLKYIGLFLLIMLGLLVIISLLNLTSINTSITTKLTIIATSIAFFITSFIAAHNIKEKGYIIGLKLSILLILVFILINLIFFKTKFSIDRFIYYIILIASSTLGGSFGKNLKQKK